jgi:hypothetical protein
MTTALTLIRARRMPSGPVTYYAFNESSRRDAEALARLRFASPDRRECRVTVDFDPAGSAALNVPVRELVTAERDRLRALLVEARKRVAPYDDRGGRWWFDGDAVADLLARIDAALAPVPEKETAA